MPPAAASREAGVCANHAALISKYQHGLTSTYVLILPVSLQQPYLTQFIYQIDLEGQLPHKTVNSTLQLVIVNNNFTIFWGVYVLKLIKKYIVSDKDVPGACPRPQQPPAPTSPGAPAAGTPPRPPAHPSVTFFSMTLEPSNTKVCEP